jgi:hypothetical protein
VRNRMSAAGRLRTMRSFCLDLPVWRPCFASHVSKGLDGTLWRAWFIYGAAMVNVVMLSTPHKGRTELSCNGPIPFS